MATQKLFLNITHQAMLHLGQQHILNINRDKKLVNTYVLFNFCATGKARDQQQSSLQFRTKHSSEDHLMVRLDHVSRLIFYLVTLHSILTKKRKSTAGLHCTTMPRAHQQSAFHSSLARVLTFPSLSWKRSFSLPSCIVVHCKPSSWTAVTSEVMVVLQMVKTEHLPTKIQVQRCSKCDLLAPNQVLTAQDL